MSLTLLAGLPTEVGQGACRLKIEHFQQARTTDVDSLPLAFGFHTTAFQRLEVGDLGQRQRFFFGFGPNSAGNHMLRVALDGRGQS